MNDSSIISWKVVQLSSGRWDFPEPNPIACFVHHCYIEALLRQKTIVHSPSHQNNFKMSPSVSVQFFVLLILCSFCLLSSSGSEIRRKREDSLRCRPFNGFFCRWSCRLLGHSDGFCDEENECRCSEEGLEKYVCGGNVTETAANNLCAGWCQFRGLQTGDCNTEMGVCECTEGDKLSTRHIKCINEEVCSIYCQFREKKSSGICTGKNDWECVCLSKDENRNEIEILGN